jgi:hypothetical protein
MRLGLAAHALDGDGQKSSNYGLFARTAEGHREAESPNQEEG